MGWIACLILLGLAINSAVETIHHGRIFTSLRAKIEARGDLLSDIVGCPYCLSYHVGYILTLLLTIANCLITGAVWTNIFAAPVLWLASTRLAHLINDGLKQFNRTPKALPFLPPMENIDAVS